MGFDEALRDMFFALFGLLVLLQAWFGAWGIVRLWRLRAGLPSLRRAARLAGLADFPDDQTAAALGPVAVSWRRAGAWSDLCAGIAGIVGALLAISVAVALPISSTYSTAIARASVLVLTGFALSGTCAVIGRCIAIAWITPPPAAITTPPLSRARHRVIAVAIALWAVDAVVTLVVVQALITAVQTPPEKDYIVPAYVALVLSFPLLLGLALTAAWRLSRRWRRLVQSALPDAPNLSDSIRWRFRTFAGNTMTSRLMMVGPFVLMGQSLLVGQIISFEPYFGDKVANTTFVCAVIMIAIMVVAYVLPFPLLTLPHGDETSAVGGELPAS